MPVRKENRAIQDSEDKDHDYYVIQKPAMQGEVLKFELIKLLGPSVGKLRDITQGKKGINQSKALEVFGDAIKGLFDSTNPKDLTLWLQSLVIGVTRDGDRITLQNFDEIYTDNMMEFYKACAFVLEVNFANFFKGLNLGDTLKKAKNLVE